LCSRSSGARPALPDREAGRKGAYLNIAESLNRIPGVQLVRDVNGDGQEIAIRGLGTSYVSGKRDRISGLLSFEYRPADTLSFYLDTLSPRARAARAPRFHSRPSRRTWFQGRPDSSTSITTSSSRTRTTPRTPPVRRLRPAPTPAP
jgi:hypothetical protein